MVIYHVSTQEAYDDLMKKLEKEGYKWMFSGFLPTKGSRWRYFGEEACFKVSPEDKKINWADKEYYEQRYPEVEIIEYRIPEEEEMETLDFALILIPEDVWDFVIYSDDKDYLLTDMFFIIHAWKDRRDRSKKAVANWVMENEITFIEAWLNRERVVTIEPVYQPLYRVELPDPVNHPNHYNVGGIETIDLIRTMLTPEEFQGYCKGNILKYRERAEHKGNPEENYAKARKYMEFLKESCQ